MSAHEDFIAPARMPGESGPAALLRAVLGILVFAGTWAGLLLLTTGQMTLLAGREAVSQTLATMLDGSSAMGMMLTLGIMAFVWPALWLTLRLVHRRHLVTLIGPGGLRPGAMLRGMGLVALAGGLALSLMGVLPALVAQNLVLSDWLAILMPALLLIFFQSSAEELLFRGYLYQLIAARGPVWAAMVIPSLLFGLLHHDPAYGANAWMMVLVAVVMGLISADAVRRTGNLSLSLGLHFGNNIIAILLLSYDRSGGLALWVDLTPLDATSSMRTSMAIQLLAMLSVYAGVIAVSRDTMRMK